MPAGTALRVAKYPSSSIAQTEASMFSGFRIPDESSSLVGFMMNIDVLLSLNPSIPRVSNVQTLV